MDIFMISFGKVSCLTSSSYESTSSSWSDISVH